MRTGHGQSAYKIELCSFTRSK